MCKAGDQLQIKWPVQWVPSNPHTLCDSYSLLGVYWMSMWMNEMNK